jgi:hypothetical protein
LATNRQAYWDYCINKRDADPESKFLKKMRNEGKMHRLNEPDFIIEYMQTSGLYDDYVIICNWNPREIVFYIGYICDKYYLPKPSLYDVFFMDVKQFFGSYGKKNADKKALAYTSTIQKALDTLFADVSMDQRYRIASCVNLYMCDQQASFDELNEILHKP